MLPAHQLLLARYKTEVFPLLRKGIWAVTDQGLFAGTNFILNILLARWLSPVEYGAFAVVYTTFLLAGQMHTALLTEPMTVFGAGRFDGRFSAYLRGLLWGHGGLSLIGSLVAVAAGLWLAAAGSELLAKAVLGLAVALPFLLFLWLVRMVPYTRHTPERAIPAGFVYLGSLILALFVLNTYGLLSVEAALIAMAGASLLAGICITVQYDIQPFRRLDRTLRQAIVREHWTYGRWAVATSVLAWVPGNAYYLLLPIWGGLEAGGALKAIMILLMPILHANGAFSTLLVPELVQARSEGRFWKLMKVTVAFFLSASLIYWLLIGAFSTELIGWLYGTQYLEYADLLWVLGAVPVLISICTVLSAALRAIEAPQWIFRAYILSTGVTLTVGVAFIALWGMQGAAYAIVLTAGATVAGLILSWRALRSREIFSRSMNVRRMAPDDNASSDPATPPAEIIS